MIYLPIVLLATGALLIWAKRKQDQTKANRLRKQALNWCQQSFDLLLLLQKRRGMMGSLLSGDKQFAQPLDELNRELDLLLQQLSRSDLEVATLKDNGGTPENLLSQRFESPAESFQVHSATIENLLDQIWSVAERFQLATHHDSSYRKRSVQALRILPALVELLGQMRGLSTQTASQGRCSAAMRLRLVYLSDQVMQNLSRGDYPREAAEQFILRIEQLVLSMDRIQVPAAELFAQATEAIESYSGHTRQLLRQLA